MLASRLKRVRVQPDVRVRWDGEGREGRQNGAKKNKNHPLIFTDGGVNHHKSIFKVGRRRHWQRVPTEGQKKLEHTKEGKGRRMEHSTQVEKKKVGEESCGLIEGTKDAESTTKRTA